MNEAQIAILFQFLLNQCKTCGGKGTISSEWQTDYGFRTQVDECEDCNEMREYMKKWWPYNE